MPNTSRSEQLAVLFVHGVGIREPNYARSAVRMLRREYVKATGGASANDNLVVESVYWAPAVIEREDHLLESAFPDRAAGWFSGLNKLTHQVSNGSTLSLIPLALSGIVRHVPGIPRIHWPTLRWAVSNFVGDIVAYQVTPNSRVVYDAVHDRVDQGLRRLAEKAPDAPLCVIAHSLGSVIASDHFYDLHKGRVLEPAATPLERGETLTFLYTLGSPIALWMERYGDFSEPVQHPGQVQPGPGDRGRQRVDQFLRPRRRALVPPEGPVRQLRPRRRRGPLGERRRPPDRHVAGLPYRVLERHRGDPADRAEPRLAVERAPRRGPAQGRAGPPHVVTGSVGSAC